MGQKTTLLYCRFNIQEATTRICARRIHTICVPLCTEPHGGALMCPADALRVYQRVRLFSILLLLLACSRVYKIRLCLSRCENAYRRSNQPRYCDTSACSIVSVTGGLVAPIVALNYSWPEKLRLIVSVHDALTHVAS